MSIPHLALAALFVLVALAMIARLTHFFVELRRGRALRATDDAR